MDQGLSRALQAVARGSGLRAAAREEGVPYSSLNKAWKALEGDVKGPAWQAYVATLAPAPPPAAAPASAAAPAESPLAPRLKRKADRHGDAVPYGQHGQWGSYRDGVKEMTQKISQGKISAAEASEQLEEAGVRVSEYSLDKKAKKAPGQSPVKGGVKMKMPKPLQSAVHEEIQVLRKHDLPVSKSLVKAMVLSKLTEEQQAEIFPKGMTNKVYYKFLDNYDMNTEQTKPLEKDRDLWLTSKNAEAQYRVWAELAVKNGMAEWNPDFDPSKPYDEMIYWLPGGLERLLSMDETDVRTDQSKRGKSKESRSVIINAPGSRMGHSKGKSGRQPTVKTHRGGQAGGSKKVGGKQGLKPGKLDRGDAIATKSAAKISFAGGTRGDGKSLSPHIMANHPLSTEELSSAPDGTARDASGNIVPATFNVNTSGGMLEDDMVIWLKQIAAPSAPTVTPQNRGMICLDGLGQHHTFQVVSTSDQLGFDIALRFPHGSSRGQHEDFEHFSHFSPAFEDAKVRLQVALFQAMRAKAEAEGREPTRAELMAAANLSDAQSLAAAKDPWVEAFSEARVKNGWKNEGIVPFSRKLFWDLKKEEEQMGVTVSNPPPADLSGFNIPPLSTTAPAATSTTLAATSTALAATSAAATPWNEGIDAEVERLLRAEVGDPTLGVAPVPPLKNQPKLGASLLFRLPGGVTGEVGKQLVRAKEVERRLTIARKQYNSDKKDQKKAQRADNDFVVAAGALKDLKASKFDLKPLSLPQLQSLVRALSGGKAKGNKPELRELLQKTFGGISAQQFQELCVKVDRGVAQLTLATPAPEQLALHSPPETTVVGAPEPTTVEALPLALSRPRRG